MLHLGKFAAGIVTALALATPTQTVAQSWNETVAKAKGQKLVIVNQGNPAFDATLDEFSKKFGIKVEATVGRPSQTVSRVRTEQTNNVYVWDVWWAITGAMTTVASPAGMFQPMEPLMILPEVKDASNWRHADYRYGDTNKAVFLHMHEISRNIFRNTSVMPDVKVTNADSLMNPKLKGKIVMRDASVPNAGSYALAPIYKAKGADFLANFLKTQQPRVLDNPEQIDQALWRGGAALAIGGQNSSLSQCQKDGGCKNIEEIPAFASASSRGIAVFKNAPNPDAAKVFINWLLSKEGQTFFVNEWAKANTSGAVSFRKDVAPAKGYESDLPDFSKPDEYVFVSTEKGTDEVKAVAKIFKTWAGK